MRGVDRGVSFTWAGHVAKQVYTFAQLIYCSCTDMLPIIVHLRQWSWSLTRTILVVHSLSHLVKGNCTPHKHTKICVLACTTYDGRCNSNTVKVFLHAAGLSIKVSSCTTASNTWCTVQHTACTNRTHFDGESSGK